jgi:putative hydrolase of the HAD superfamily
MQIKSIIFDNDGTLYRMPRGFKERVVGVMANYISLKLGMAPEAVLAERNRLITKHGVESTEFVFHLEYGLNIRDFLESTYLSLNFEELGIKRDEKLKNMLESQNMQKSILTNNPSRFARKLLRTIGIEGMFQHVIGCGEMNFQLKPRIEAFLQALQITGYDPKGTVFVDDVAEFHIQAKKLGMTTVLLANNNEKPPYVDHVIQEVYALADILEER